MNVKLKTIRFAAVGDLLLVNNPDGSPGRGLEALSDELRRFFASCDIVFANLECTLPGPEIVPTEPRVISTEKQVSSLKNSGINVVTIGNNHTFDCGDDGFHRLRGMLSDMGIPWCGAGKDLKEALQPAIVVLNGISVAFIGVVDRSSGQNQFATESSSGVAPLSVEQICSSIKTLRKRVNHVVVSPHWGEERFRIPSPDQIKQAMAFIDAGAAMVVGHHPHVLQGFELYKEVPIAYSLGNFFANEVHFTNGDRLTWNRFEQTGCIVTGEFDADRILNIQQLPVFDDGKIIRIETSGWGNRCLDKVNNLLARGVTSKRYDRETFRVKKIKPILSQLKWSKLRRMDPGKIKKAFQLLTAKD